MKYNRRHRSALLVVISLNVKHNLINIYDIKLERRTFLQLLRHVHACQVSEHQHPGFQTVRIAEWRLLLLHVDISQLTDQLQDGQKRLFNDTLLDDNLNFFLWILDNLSLPHTHTRLHLLPVALQCCLLVVWWLPYCCEGQTQTPLSTPWLTLEGQKEKNCQKPYFVMQEVRLV